jgi:hypothetical protein
MEPTALRLIVRPWSDPVIDVLGHDARSTYVERFWLGILGPSTTWFLRLVAGHLDREPDGFDLDLGEAARSLGLGSPLGRHSPLQRAVRRTVQFGLARTVGREGLDVRRRIPPLNRGQVARLPESLQGAHRDWQEALLRPTSSPSACSRPATTSTVSSASSTAGATTPRWPARPWPGPVTATAPPSAPPPVRRRTPAAPGGCARRSRWRARGSRRRGPRARRGRRCRGGPRARPRRRSVGGTARR